MSAGYQRLPFAAAHDERLRRVDIGHLRLRSNLGQEALQMLPDPLHPILRHAVAEEEQRQRFIQNRLLPPGQPGFAMGPFRHPDLASAAGLQPAGKAVMVRMMMRNHDVTNVAPGTVQLLKHHFPRRFRLRRMRPWVNYRKLSVPVRQNIAVHLAQRRVHRNRHLNDAAFPCNQVCL
ncbi:hypothetical protein D3C73_613210 [compost metagenome]